MASYKSSFSLAHRLSESQRAREMGKIPIICERRQGSSLPELSTRKYVVSPTMSVGTFIKVLTERVNMEVAQQIFLFLGESVLMSQRIAMSDLHRVNKDEDGFIYVTYSSEKDNARAVGAYQSTHTEAERAADAGAIMRRGMLPVIVEKDDECRLRDLTDDKFDIQPDMPISTFVQLITTRVALAVGRRIHLNVEGYQLGSSEQPMSRVYTRFADKDGFLYVTFSDAEPRRGTPIFPNDEDAREAAAAAAAKAEWAKERERVTSAIQSPDKSRSSAVPGGLFKEAYSEPERRAIARDAHSRGSIPIICERRAGSTLADLANKKFLVAPTMQVGRFASLLRDRVAAEVSKDIYLFIGNNVLTARKITTKELYESNRDADGLLYVTYDDTEGNARHMGVYKSTHSQSHRLSEAARAIALGKTPIIVERASRSRAKEMEQKKFWVPLDMPLPDFAEILRARIAEETDDKVYLFVDGHPVGPREHRTTKDFYEKYKDDDNFVYVTYSNRPTVE